MYNCEDPISSYHFDDNDPLSFFDGILCSPERSIVLNKNKEINAVLISDSKHRDYNNFPFKKDFSYKEDSDQIIIELGVFGVKTKYWDLSKIKEHILTKNSNE